MTVSVDLTCWEEKENLKPEVESNGVAKQDHEYPDEPTQEEILLIKQKRSQNEVTLRQNNQATFLSYCLLAGNC